MFEIINYQKHPGQPKKVPQQILQNRNSKGLRSKEQKKANIATGAIQQTQINPKYNKNTTLIKSLASLYIWEQHQVSEIK